MFTLVLSSFSADALAGVLVKEGCRGEAVATVQTLLIEQGYLVGEADGVAGAATANAIRSFQRAHGLKVDGVCGELTFAELGPGMDASLIDSYCETHGDHSGQHPSSFFSSDMGRCVYVGATGYSAFDPGNNSYTACGTLVRHGVIAVDPSFIPLGTRVYIPGYGEAIAEDIGWGIQGNFIDVAFDTHEEALAFGRQDLEIYIMD